MRAKKRLGQHFLNDASAVRRIVDAAAIEADDLVVEIGPGGGALTGRLLERGARVVGIELDRTLCAKLQERCGARGRLSVLNRDVLRVDLPELVQSEGFERAVLVGNLPYPITGAILEQILDARAVLKRAVVTVQREVGRRITAPPGGKDYGILSIAVQIRTRPEWLFDLPPDHFRPMPKVDSSVLRFDFSAEPPVRIEDERLFFRAVRMAFQQRRKMLKNTLLELVGYREEVLMKVLSAAGVDPHDRPEAVSVEQFERVCRTLACDGAVGNGQKGRKIDSA